MGLFAPIRFDSDGTYYISGQLPSDVTAGLAEQAASSLANIEAVLSSKGLDKSSMLKVTIFTTKIEDIAEINEPYAAFFAGEAEMPTRSAFGVSGLVGGAMVEIDCIGHR